MWVKICGITIVDDARCVVAAGGSAIGLNFFSRSPRYVSTDAAMRIADAVREDVDVVGVFVNVAPESVATFVRDVGLTAVQFHGDESAAEIEAFRQLCPDIPVIRALRIGSDTPDLAARLAEFNGLHQPPDAILADAYVAGEYGGTGRMISPELLPVNRFQLPRLVLAGGLTPANVGAAIDAVRPWGVDTASGVESAPGRKSPEKIEAFIAACRDHGTRERLSLS